MQFEHVDRTARSQLILLRLHGRQGWMLRVLPNCSLRSPHTWLSSSESAELQPRCPRGLGDATHACGVYLKLL